MFVVLQSHITIGDYTFSSVNNVEIKRSIHNIGSTAKIIIPASANLLMKNQPVGVAVETAKQFKTGDAVEIQLAYGDDLRTEFKGFVKRINYTTPVEIECEDYVYWLKKKDIKHSWASTTLNEVLNYIITGTHSDIKISGQVPDVAMTDFEIKSNAADALGKIKTNYGLAVYFEMDGTLYAGLSYVPDKGTVKYNLNGEECNVIKGDSLKYRNADDVKLKAKAIHMKADNTKVEVEVGDDDGELRTLYFYDVESTDQLKKLAEQELEKYKFNGYEGKITTFLQPYAEPGMTAEIEDVEFQERSGSYYIEATEVGFSTSGARRIADIGIKLNE